MNQREYDDLREGGYSGSLNDMKRSALLTVASDKYQIDDVYNEWLISQGFQGNSADATLAYLRNQGFVGSLNDVRYSGRLYNLVVNSSTSSIKWDSLSTQFAVLSSNDTVVTISGNPGSVRGLQGVESGQRKKFEIKLNSVVLGSVADTYIGLQRSEGNKSTSAFSILLQGDGNVFTGGSSGANYIGPSTQGYTVGDVITIWVDLSSGVNKAWFGKNGTPFSGNPLTATGGTWSTLSTVTTWFPFIWNGNEGSKIFELITSSTY